MSVERPIVLVKKTQHQHLSELVAPRNRYFGIMLAYTPLQYLILRNNFSCLICTSANISDEPIIYEDNVTKLVEVADYVVAHDRRIHTFVDDSVVRSVQGICGDEIQIIRRARGYTPKLLTCHHNKSKILSVGAELKNTICMVKNEAIFLSQYIGDLKTLSTYQSFQNIVSHTKRLFDFEPEIVACDLHPNFLNTIYASKLDIPLVKIQHHHAHLCACMLENNYYGDAIGVIFDGMGYGTDGNIWGGEFLIGNYKEFTRAGHFEYFPLPGGDICRKKIAIAAFACLLKILGHKNDVVNHWESPLTEDEMHLYQKMIETKINSPLTSSVGRIFDVVSSILGLCQNVAYEGQAAILLEQSFDTTECNLEKCYPFSICCQDEKHTVSLDETYLEILNDKNKGIPIDMICWKFHNTMVKIICDMCQLLSDIKRVRTVVLSGGCFQNKFLLEATIKILSSKGFNVLYHKHFPTNDSSIALGQAASVIYSDVV
jgi:hydrogenase maturation protein HypF